MGDVGQRIGELLVGQRAVPPVGEARRFVEMRAGDLLDQLVAGNAVAEAADHGRDLRVEHRMRKQPAEVKMISISWRAAWKTLATASLAIRREERRKVEVLRQRVDSAVAPGAAIWIEAELRPGRSRG